MFAVVVIGAGAASFADQASQGGVDRDLLGAHAWGRPGQSVRQDIYEKLVPVPGGPYPVRRGARVTVDGSASRPKKKITSYQWQFETDCPGGVQGQTTTVSDKKAKIVAVCDTKATLTVSDGRQTKSKSTTIKVKGNLKDVPYNQGDDVDARTFPFDTAQGTFVFGMNRCAIEWAESQDPNLTDHWLHKPDDGNDVDTAQVSDPGGPYDGFFYVTGHNLKITRQMIINKQLLPGGPVYDLNEAKHKKDIENIVDATIDHERIHGDLVEKVVKGKKQPKFLRDLAAVVDTSEEGVQNRADVVIGDGETALKTASSESKVQNKLAEKWKDKTATIIRPTANTSKKYTLARIGDTENK